MQPGQGLNRRFEMNYADIFYAAGLSWDLLVQCLITKPNCHIIARFLLLPTANRPISKHFNHAKKFVIVAKHESSLALFSPAASQRISPNPNCGYTHPPDSHIKRVVVPVLTTKVRQHVKSCIPPSCLHPGPFYSCCCASITKSFVGSWPMALSALKRAYTRKASRGRKGPA